MGVALTLSLAFASASGNAGRGQPAGAPVLAGDARAPRDETYFS